MKVIFYQYRLLDSLLCYSFDFTEVDRITPSIKRLEQLTPHAKGIFITDKEKT